MTQNDTNEKIRRLSLRFEGEVQGVGFRWTSRRLANEIGLTGWVRNEWDGSVSMELQGTSDQIARFFGRLAHAWSSYQPDYIIDQKEEIPAIRNDNAFQVRF